MATVVGRVWRAMLMSLRGVQARLVGGCLLAAVLLGAAGVYLFALTLGHGLRDNVDNGLQARADTVVSDLGNSGAVRGNSPAIRPSRGPLDESQAITAVYSPAGQLVVAHPTLITRRPAYPIAGAVAAGFGCFSHQSICGCLVSYAGPTGAA